MWLLHLETGTCSSDWSMEIAGYCSESHFQKVVTCLAANLRLAVAVLVHHWFSWLTAVGGGPMPLRRASPSCSSISIAGWSLILAWGVLASPGRLAGPRCAWNLRWPQSRSIFTAFVRAVKADPSLLPLLAASYSTCQKTARPIADSRISQEAFLQCSWNQRNWNLHQHGFLETPSHSNYSHRLRCSGDSYAFIKFQSEKTRASLMIRRGGRWAFCSRWAFPLRSLALSCLKPFEHVDSHLSGNST